MYFKYGTILKFLNETGNSETYSRSYLIINLEKRNEKLAKRCFVRIKNV